MPGFSTRAIRAASRIPEVPQPPLNVPIYASSTFEVADANELAELLEFARPGHSYSRYSNPTLEILGTALAELEDGEAGIVTASGMAAVHAAVLSVLRSGHELLIPRAVYGGMVGLASAVLDRVGIAVRAVDTTDRDAVAEAIGPHTRMLWLETISNPTTALADIADLAELAHARELVVAVDNTFASPALATPLAHGADLVVHSTTKYIGGHSDLVGGALVGKGQLVRAARAIMLNVGGNGSPWDAFLTLRGLKTLDLRMERHSSNALRVARALEVAPGVAAVHYPGLASHPQHELATRVLRNGRAGGMLALEVEGGRKHGERFLERVRLAVHATSLGGVETLVSHPASSSHRQLADDELASAGLSPGMLRVSIGLEDPEDLVEDLVAAARPEA
ncbi:MAG: aminotransferase class I/II-fold pyridoxal phosphate-dependent enzyme [Chloroflexi bacterium]|nr:aminotransferase class I/II-fold pyridoxal phosphate-dependent enzyme [Chloroflexota bacterium]